MTTDRSFGDWLRTHRRALDLTQEELARQVGCSAITLRKLEAEERRPSKQIAERLADVFKVAPDARPAFLRFARGDPFAAPADAKIPDKPEAKKSPTHNLPLQLTSFVGREKVIAEVERLISTGRLVTLTGAGGTGKTRLALQVAFGLRDDFPDGVWLVEFASLVSPELVPQAIAAMLGVKEAPGRAVKEMLAEHLRSKRALLVLDNCEHLVQACAEVAEQLLRLCPRLTVLATSREALNIGGEAVFVVPSLSLPDRHKTLSVNALAQSEAVQLFIERASAALPGFKLTNGNAPAIAEVCQQLDGIPLAVELAAVRTKVLQVEEIAARLNDRFSLLRGGSRTALPRHQTLQALMDWSFDLLSEPERALLQRLAVFAGGCTLEAAEAVASGEGVETGAVLDLLVQLVAKSLVIAEREQGEGTRYRMLETIRQYAQAKLADSGELNGAHRRHAEYYLALAMCKHSAWDPAWYDRANPENDNFLAALGWSQSAGGNPEVGLRLVQELARAYWGSTGRFGEARLWSKNALAFAQTEGNRDAQAFLLNAAGFFAGLQADYAAAEAGYEASMKLYQELGNLPMSARALNRLGWVARERGDAATARLRLEESLAIFQELGNRPVIGEILNNLGEVAIMQDDAARATALLDEALTLNRALGEMQAIGWSLNHLGHLAQLQGDYSRASSLHLESLEFFRKLAPRWVGVAWAFQSLGETALGQRDSALAATHLTAALDLFREMEDREGVSWCLAGLAGAAVLDEEPTRAARLWGAAEALRQSLGAREAPASRATRERLMAAAREQLGEAAFAEAWAKGQAMTAEQAIAYALEESD